MLTSLSRSDETILVGSVHSIAGVRAFRRNRIFGSDRQKRCNFVHIRRVENQLLRGITEGVRGLLRGNRNLPREARVHTLIGCTYASAL